MLKDKDRIFQNLYNDMGSDVSSSQKRGDWVNTKELTDKGKTLEILDKILRGETPKPGSYRGRVNNEPENNRKTLLDLKNA